MTTAILGVYKDNEHAVLPKFGTSGSACFDISICLEDIEPIKVYDKFNKARLVDVNDSQFMLYPACRAIVPTGLIFDIPWAHVLKVYIRSSAAAKMGLTLANNVGIIDSDYVDPLFIILQNNTEGPIHLQHEDRVAQGMLEPILGYFIHTVDQRPQQKTERNGGIGSTGK
jgi:dUTP pyrophosphatase